MDQMLLDLARDNLSLKDTMAAIQGRPAALFMVEFSGDDASRGRRPRREAGEALQGSQRGDGLCRPSTRRCATPLWNLRSAALPLLFGMPGDRKPVTFVEDTAVAPEQLPEFVARFREMLHRHGTDGAFYGHASVGCLHIRPVLNLKDHDDVVRMRRITEEVTDLVLEFGGSLSGEHGDGLARSEWNRKMFGPASTRRSARSSARSTRTTCSTPARSSMRPPMTENLRYGPGYRPSEPPTVFDYCKQEGFVRAVEMCNGSGVCRKMQGGTMCPSFRATLRRERTARAAGPTPCGWRWPAKSR